MAAQRPENAWILLLSWCCYLAVRLVDAQDQLQSCSIAIDCPVVDIYGLQTHLCTLATCAGHCGRDEKVPAAGCRCDPRCLYFGDCCPDYEAVCVTERDFLGLNHTAQMETRLQVQSTVECATYPYKKTDGATQLSEAYRKTVKKCHPENTASEETRALCENPDHDVSSLEHILVTSNATKLLYKNRFCALCNNELEGNITRSNPDFVCDSANQQIDLLRESKSPEEFIEALLTECTYQANVLALPIPQKRIECSIYSSSPCGEDDDIALHKLCDSYTSNVRQTDKPDYYQSERNAHCAKCNNIELADLECEVRDREDLPPLPVDEYSYVDTFTIIMSHEPKSFQYQSFAVCTKDTIRDINRNICVPKTCTFPMIYVNDSCHSIDEAKMPRVTEVHADAIEIFMELDMVMQDAPGLNQIALGVTNTWASHSDVEVTATAQTRECDSYGFTSGRCFYLMSIVLTSEASSSNVLLNTISNPKVFKPIFDLLLGSFFNITQVVVVNYDASVAELTCTDGQKVLRDGDENKPATAVLIDAVKVSEFDKPDVLRVEVNNSVVLPPNTTAVQLVWLHDYVQDLAGMTALQYRSMHWRMGAKVAAVCGVGLMFCEKVAIESQQGHEITAQASGEYEVKVTHNGRAHSAVLAPDEFMIDGDTLVACAHRFRVVAAGNGASLIRSGLALQTVAALLFWLVHGVLSY